LDAVELYFRLAFATGLVLAPGWMLSRAIGLRGVAAALSWSLALLFGALTLVFLLSSPLTTGIALFAVAGLGAGAAMLVRRRDPATRARPVPGRLWAGAAGALLGIVLWHVAGSVQGDGLFHLARVRKLLAFDDLTLHRVVEFKDGGLHPGYAFPLWHGFVAVVAKLSGVDPEQVFLHLPTLLAPLGVLIAYEVGWAMFRQVWAAGAVALGQVTLACFAAGHGGSYVLLAQPETAARQLLVPAALALAFETIRAPSVSRYASIGAVGLSLVVIHPTYALFLWIPFVGFLAVRALWMREELRHELASFGALIVPATLYLLWLIPILRDTASVAPDAVERRRALTQYASYLVIGSDTSFHLKPEVFIRTGAVAIAAVALFPLACLASRRRWAAFVAGGSLAVLAICLVSPLFAHFTDVVSVSQGRRLAGFFPFAFAFAGGLGVLSRVLGPLLPSIALIAGAVLEAAYPGNFEYALGSGAPGLIVWIAAAAGVVGLVIGLVRRGLPFEANAAFGAALFCLPVVAVGLAKWTPAAAPPLSTLSPGLVHALRTVVPPGAVVYSDQETSYRLAAFAPVYIAVAPPGHVADTKENQPYARARDARVFTATGNLDIPLRYGADFLVVDRRRTRRTFELPRLYGDAAFVLYRLPVAAP
jgi:hypothetical protein